MFRHRPRTSRALIGLLIVTLVLGAVAYWHNTSKSKARELAAGAGESGTTPSALKDVPPIATAKTSSPISAPAHMTTTTPPIPSSRAPGAADNAVSGSNTAPCNAASNRATGSPAAPRTSAAPATQPKATDFSSSTLSQAQAAYAAGDLLAARDAANGALLSGKLSDADARAAKQLISEINQTVVFSPKRFADDRFGGTYSVQRGDVLDKIARKHDVTWELLCRLNGIPDPSKLRAGATIKVMTGPFHAVVDKSDFTMDIYLGEPPAPGVQNSMYVTTYRVGLGTDDSTPTGTWMVEPHKKLPNPTYFSPRGEGVIEADDPKNPLGEFWIGLSGIDGHAIGKESYGIHGTIEPDSIGKMMSLGCIRMLNEDVAVVYEMLVEGKSTVVVRE